MKICLSALLFAALVVLSTSADAEKRAPESRDTVVRIYRDFAAEVVIEDPVQEVLSGQPESVWARYFSKSIVRLYAKVRKCSDVHGLCMTEMSPLWWSQDAGSVTVKIQPGASDSVVLATIEYPKDAVNSGTAKLVYQMVRENREWKIADIEYPDGTTLKGWLLDALEGY